MSQDNDRSISKLLKRWSDGDEEAAAEVYPLVYKELHRLAKLLFHRRNQDQTLQTTAVIHEAYLNLIGSGGDKIEWQNRSHFFGLMARVMRRVLVDHARHRNRIKRGGAVEKVTFEEARLLGEDKSPDVILLDDALKGLEKVDPEKAAIVELRFFGGLTIEETAEFLGISTATVVRQWRRARAWLYHELWWSLKVSLKVDPERWQLIDKLLTDILETSFSGRTPSDC